MTKEEMEAIVAKAQADVAKANKLAGLNDVQKAHYNTLSDSDKDSFLAKSADEQLAIVKNLADANPVIYKSADGSEFRKNDDPRMIALAKSSDENAKIAKAATDKLANAELTKRAVELYKNHPGTEETKVAMLKSIESIEDETVRKSALDAAKAADSALAANFVRKGVNGNSAASVEAGTANDQLDALAKAHDAAHKCGYAKAYDAVIQTEQGKSLYEQTIAH